MFPLLPVFMLLPLLAKATTNGDPNRKQQQQQQRRVDMKGIQSDLRN